MFHVIGKTYGPETRWYLSGTGCLWTDSSLAVPFNTAHEANAAIELISHKFPSVEFTVEPA